MVVTLTLVSLVLPILLAVAFVTLAERKGMGALQRRVGPNAVGLWGMLQPFADALKLVMKETVLPSQANNLLLVMAPVFTLTCRLLGFVVIPFSAGVALLDSSMGILFSLAISALTVYGVLYAGWSSASSYAFIGAVRSAAQMVSYELSLSASVLAVILAAGSMRLTQIVESQVGTWHMLPFLPLLVIFHVSALAETNRTPFDLPEAESELVAGYMTEHRAMPFVLFFLAEYAALLLMSTLTSVLFLGGYQTHGWSGPLVLGAKTCFMLFLYIWARATLPRLRYDQLMTFGWTGMLPLAFGLLASVPCGLLLGAWAV